MRTRVHYASWVVAAVSCLWLLVVFQYSIRRDRLHKRLASDFESFKKQNDERFALVVRYIDSVSNAIPSALSITPGYTSFETVEEEPAFVPRLVGRGQTKSKHSVFIYEDWEDSPGHISRRYVMKFPLSQN